MKKLLAMTMALAMALSIAACGGNSGSSSSNGSASNPVDVSGSQGGDSSVSGPAAWTSVADLENAKIAVQEGTTGNDLALEIPGAKISAFKATAQCGMELMNGRVDCIIIDSNPAQDLVDSNPDKLMLLDFPASEEKETYAIATQKNDEGAALAEEFNAAMQTLKENGTFDAIMQKNIAKDESVVLPELPTYESKGTLVMGTNCEFPPFEYLDSNGDYLGFDIDYATYLCATMGYDLKIENMDFDALIPALQSGRLDFIAAGLTRDEEREKNANFTDGYYEAVQSIVVAKPAK